MAERTTRGYPTRQILPLIQEAKSAILRELPVRPYLIMLYGSEARGEATPESDIDLLVVLEDSSPELVDRVRDAVYKVMWNDDFSRLISVCVLSRREYEYQKQKGYSFIQNVEQDGVVLWQAA